MKADQKLFLNRKKPEESGFFRFSPAKGLPQKRSWGFHLFQHTVKHIAGIVKIIGTGGKKHIMPVSSKLRISGKIRLRPAGRKILCKALPRPPKNLVQNS